KIQFTRQCGYENELCLFNRWEVENQVWWELSLFIRQAAR
ncbi:unnamed protein product, partial [Musa textilis]